MDYSFSTLPAPCDGLFDLGVAVVAHATATANFDRKCTFCRYGRTAAPVNEYLCFVTCEIFGRVVARAIDGDALRGQHSAAHLNTTSSRWLQRELSGRQGFKLCAAATFHIER